MKTNGRKTTGRTGSFRNGAAVVSALFCLWTASGAVAEEALAPVDEARTVLEKWVETRRIISQEQSEWTLGREVLNERIDLVQGEIDSLRGKITQTEQTITDADKKREELLAENERLKTASGSLLETIVRLETGIRELLVRLPDPIRDRVKPLSQRLPDDAAATKLSLSERFQNVVGILNEVDKFNRDITVTSEVHTLPDGTSAEVTAMYIGVGQGYYVGAQGNIAGTGGSGRQGWEWKPVPEAAAAISEAIAIVKNEKAAAFVQLPGSIQ